MNYQVFRNTLLPFWKKSYYWVVYDDIAGPYMVGWTWTYNGACNEAEMYVAKIQDGRFIK